MKEYWEISSLLEKHNVLFAEFWDMGEPVFTDSIETAAICYDDVGNKINYVFNKEFWDSLTPYQRAFVISHEVLHVLFQHGNRLQSIIGKPQKMHIANIAADIIVNEFLIRRFGFEPMRLGELYEKLITEKSTVGHFPNLKTFEEYYILLQSKSEKLKGIKTLDDHDKSFIGKEGQALPGQIPSILVEDIVESAIEKQTEQQVQKMKEMIGTKDFKAVSNSTLAGTISGTVMKVIQKFAKIKKQKWITLISDWTRRKIKEKEEETWIMPNRRLTCFSNSSVFLPADYIVEKEEKGKIDVWLYMDTSGSCVNFATRFFKAAEFIPTSHFNVRLFCFDTRVFETDLKSRQLYGFGGTRFDIIETDIQHRIKKERKRYPDSVWILTDGYGNTVRPEIPSRWKWFMTDYNSKRYISKESKIYDLKDYE
jgi:predicted metal-dependent peptidase